MALYAFDGTWNEDHPEARHDTNVVLFRDAYDHGPVLYLPGPGTRGGWLGKLAGGITGLGARARVNDALRALATNLANGDRVVDVVGFSRGAAIALHFANCVAERYNGQAVRFLGLFDTVPSFGIPGNDIDWGWKLGYPATAERCVHAMAMDEARYNFPLHRVPKDARLTEMWFRGVHSDVGGGNGNTARSSIALDWVLGEAHRAGLRINTAKVMENRALMDPCGAISRRKIDVKLGRRQARPGDVLHASVHVPQRDAA
jgi:uncharacterized protein (DUF2235 family)